MEDILITLLQFLFEFVIEVFGGWPFDWAISWKSREKADAQARWCLIWFILGGGLAAISILIFHRTWISHPALRIANLILAPIVSGFISRALARRRQHRRPEIIPRNHFWQAFWFTFGMVFIRFAYAPRY